MNKKDLSIRIRLEKKILILKKNKILFRAYFLTFWVKFFINWLCFHFINFIITNLAYSSLVKRLNINEIDLIRRKKVIDFLKCFW